MASRGVEVKLLLLPMAIATPQLQMLAVGGDPAPAGVDFDTHCGIARARVHQLTTMESPALAVTRGIAALHPQAVTIDGLAPWQVQALAALTGDDGAWSWMCWGRRR